MNKSVQNDRERGKCRLETTTFSRIRIERDSSNIDRSIDRSILWRECGQHLDLKLANWKSGKVEFAWVDLNKRRFERCNLTGNQLAMKGWYKKTG